MLQKKEIRLLTWSLLERKIEFKGKHNEIKKQMKIGITSSSRNFEGYRPSTHNRVWCDFNSRHLHGIVHISCINFNGKLNTKESH